MYGKEIGSERASNQRDRKNTSPFLYESERERVARVFGGEKQREAFELVLCVWSFLNSRSAVRVLRVHAR